MLYICTILSQRTMILNVVVVTLENRFTEAEYLVTTKWDLTSKFHLGPR